MHSRLLRGEILTSEIIDRLSCQGEVLYRRLMSVVDDYGRFDARATVVKSDCYKIKQGVREPNVAKWIAECADKKAIVLYEFDGKQYLVMPKVQPPRAVRSKFPDPPPDVECWRAGADAAGKFLPYHGKLKTDANACAQVNASDTNGMQMRPYSYSYSYPNSDSLTAASGGSKAGKKVGRREKVLSEAGVIQ
jgi:hypothetical protein